MDVKPGKLYAVISGDVVGSSKLPPDQRTALFGVMKEGSKLLKEWLGKDMPLVVDIYGGDSWQMLLTEPGRALAAGLFFRAYHLSATVGKCDTRVAIAVGTIDFVPGKNVSEGDGEAFRLSGQLLAEGLGKRRMGFAAADAAADVWDVAFDLIDALVTHQWSAKRALAVSGALRGWRQEDIGRLWDPPIEQASVNRHLASAGWAAISHAVTAFEGHWTANAKK